MDDILEAVFEIVLEGSFELLKCRKVPMIIRVLVACILGALYLALAVIVIAIAWKFWGDGNIVGMLLTALIGTGILAMIGFAAWKEYKDVKD